MCSPNRQTGVYLHTHADDGSTTPPIARRDLRPAYDRTNRSRGVYAVLWGQRLERQRKKAFFKQRASLERTAPAALDSQRRTAYVQESDLFNRVPLERDTNVTRG